MVKDQDIWCALEQEYTLFEGGHELGKWPLGWPTGGYPAPQGEYYCGAGHTKVSGRAISDEHLSACLFAGIECSGTNAEVMPAQWEYQVGPADILTTGDDAWVSRYLLNRVAEQSEVIVDLTPKPIDGDWNGAGMHCNFSTKAMRSEGGIDLIHAAIKNLGKKHSQHIELYGEGNEKRLTGHHETASIDSFRWGVADRGASIRIPYTTAIKGYGLLEDRRPASNVDPHIACAAVASTALLEDSTIFNEMLEHIREWKDMDEE